MTLKNVFFFGVTTSIVFHIVWKASTVKSRQHSIDALSHLLSFTTNLSQNVLQLPKSIKTANSNCVVQVENFHKKNHHNLRKFSKDFNVSVLVLGQLTYF